LKKYELFACGACEGGLRGHSSNRLNIKLNRKLV
jgi:hypothetical protein